MERQSNPQLELFSQSNNSANFSTSSRNPIMERIWNYEKTILIIVAILITGIVAFSIGVEKGKRAVLNEQQPKVLTQAAPKIAAPVVKQVPSVMQQRGVYTIQVATFKAKANAQKTGFKNIEFRLGEIENIPLDSGIADCIISNCVINLSEDKRKVFDEAFRILKPGGRLMVSDMVLLADLSDAVLKSPELRTWLWWISGPWTLTFGCPLCIAPKAVELSTVERTRRRFFKALYSLIIKSIV